MQELALIALQALDDIKAIESHMHAKACKPINSNYMRAIDYCKLTFEAIYDIDDDDYEDRASPMLVTVHDILQRVETDAV